MTDLFLTHEGDITFSVNNNLQLTTGLGESLQVMALRLKTMLGSYQLRPAIGNALQTLVGQFLTPETLHDGEQLIFSALSGSQQLANAYIDVQGAAVNATQAVFIIYFNSPTGSSLYNIPFDFEHGLIESRVAMTIDPGSGTAIAIPAIGVDPLEVN